VLTLVEVNYGGRDGGDDEGDEDDIDDMLNKYWGR
jgi:hypothetical protein